MANIRNVARLAVLCALGCALSIAVLSVADSASAAAQEVVAQADDERLAIIQMEQLRNAEGASVIPVRVTVQSRRAVDATLEIRSRNTNLTWQLPLALAANTEVEQMLAVPVTFNQLGRLDATLFSGGDELAEARLENRAAHENAVGVLGLEAGDAEVAMKPDIGMASLIELNDLRLLSALDSLVVSEAGVRALTPEEQTELVSWVWSGHQLLVAGEAGVLAEFLPVDSPSDRSVVLMGAGVIRYVDRDWQDSVSPGISAASGMNFDNGGPIQTSNRELLNDGGFRVAGVGVMAIVLLVYLLVAGPLAFVVLSTTNRQTMAWLVLPAIAALFTGGIFIGGRALNGGRSDAYASVVEVNPIAGTRTETILISRAGKRAVELPETYSIIGTPVSNPWEFRGAGGPINVRPSRTTTEIEFEIDRGSGGTAIVSGIDPQMADQLLVEGLNLDGSVLTGSVRNRSGKTLQNMMVFVGERSVAVDQVADGESSEFSLDLSSRPDRFGSELRAWNVELEPNFFGGNPDETQAMIDGPTNGTSWLRWRTSKGGADVPDGLVTVVGWSRDLDSLRGGRGRTALVARSALPSPVAALVPAQVRSFQLDTPPGERFFFDGPDIAFEDGAGGIGADEVVQYLRPPGSDASALALGLDREVSQLRLWLDDEWRSFEIDRNTGRSVAIPDEAWENDTLTVQYQMGDFFNPGGRFAELVILTDATGTVELLPPGETSSRAPEFDEEFGPGFGPVDLGQDILIDNPLELGVEEEFEFVGDGFLEGTFDIWSVDLQPGDEITIDMKRRQGGPLDPFLVLSGPSGQIDEDDDGGAETNSRIRYTADVAGLYQIEARPLGGSPEAFGEYELIVLVRRPGGEGS